MSTVRTKVGNYRDFRDVDSGSNGAAWPARVTRKGLEPTLNSLEDRSEGSPEMGEYVIYKSGWQSPTHKDLALTNLIGHYVASSPVAIWTKLLKRCSSRVYVGTCSAEVTTTTPISDFDLLRKKISEYRSLSPGWDTYDADPPSSEAVDSACAVVDQLEQLGILPDWVIPTSDSSILMSVKYRGTRLKWEFDSDGDIAVMLQLAFTPPTYHDIELDQVDVFLNENLPQG